MQFEFHECYELHMTKIIKINSIARSYWAAQYPVYYKFVDKFGRRIKKIAVKCIRIFKIFANKTQKYKTNLSRNTAW
jgi:hypothetical protein